MVNLDKYKTGIIAKLSCDDKKATYILKEAEERLKCFSNLSDEDKEKRFEKIITYMLRKKLSSKATQFEGVILLESSIMNSNERKINEILDDYKRDPIEKKRLIDSETVKEIKGKLVVFDMLEKFKNGNKNWNYKKPLVIQKRKTISGIVKRIEKADEFDKMNLVLTGADTAMDIQTAKVCKFLANEGKRSEDGTRNFYLEEDSLLMYEDKKVNIKDLLNNFYKDNFVKLDELKATFHKMDEKTRRYKLFIVKGELVSDNSQGGNPSIKLGNPLSFEELLNSTEDPVSLHVKLNDNLASTFDAERGATVLAAGNCWSLISKDTGKEIFGMSAKLVYYTETKVKTEPIADLIDEGF